MSKGFRNHCSIEFVLRKLTVGVFGHGSHLVPPEMSQGQTAARALHQGMLWSTCPDLGDEVWGKNEDTLRSLVVVVVVVVVAAAFCCPPHKKCKTMMSRAASRMSKNIMTPWRSGVGFLWWTDAQGSKFKDKIFPPYFGASPSVTRESGGWTGGKIAEHTTLLEIPPKKFIFPNMEVPSWRRIPMRKKHPRLGKSDWHLRSGPGGKSRAGWMEPPSFVWEKWGEWKRTSNHALLRSKSIEVLKLSYCQLLPSLGGSWLGNKYIDEKTNRKHPSIHSFGMTHDQHTTWWPLGARIHPAFAGCHTKSLNLRHSELWSNKIGGAVDLGVGFLQFEGLVSFLCKVSWGSFGGGLFHGIPVKIHVGYARI